MITIHQICYNEIALLKFSYNFYKKRFPNAIFILHDNNSNDGSVQLANELGYEIRPFETNGEMDDATLQNIKNNCWKNDTTDWIIVADMDELIDISENDLLLEERNGINIINTFGFNMINLNKEFNLDSMVYGFREDTVYDKRLIFNKKFITDMNYDVGAHNCNPFGNNINFSTHRFNLLHYKYLSEEYIVNRYKELNNRQSGNNVKNSWSTHYKIHEYELREYYKSCIKKDLTKLL